MTTNQQSEIIRKSDQAVRRFLHENGIEPTCDPEEDFCTYLGFLFRAVVEGAVSDG